LPRILFDCSCSNPKFDTKKNYHQTFFKKKIIIGPFDPIALWCELGRRTMWPQEQFPVSAAAAPASSNAFTPQQQ